MVEDDRTGITRDPFKICTLCGVVWHSRFDFLSDAQVTLLGYSVHFKELQLGLLLFNHQSCRTTLAIQASTFRDLYEGSVFTTRATGTESCPGYCLHKGELRPCPAQCECAYVREIVDQVANWPKDPGKMYAPATSKRN